jgi:hypothetical protein
MSGFICIGRDEVAHWKTSHYHQTKSWKCLHHVSVTKARQAIQLSWQAFKLQKQIVKRTQTFSRIQNIKI